MQSPHIVTYLLSIMPSSLASPASGAGEDDESLSDSMSGEEGFANRWRSSHTVTASAKAKAASSSNSDTSCGLSFCAVEKTGPRKFCEHHMKMYAAMLREAQLAGKKFEVERILSDPAEAEQLFCAKLDFDKGKGKSKGRGFAAATTRDVADGS